jgi:hypothetical protein
MGIPKAGPSAEAMKCHRPDELIFGVVGWISECLLHGDEPITIAFEQFHKLFKQVGVQLRDMQVCFDGESPSPRASRRSLFETGFRSDIPALIASPRPRPSAQLPHRKGCASSFT